jgi:uncharacterized phage-associated protein
MHSPGSPVPLRDLIFFLIQESPRDLSITKLMKLVFLAEVEHVQLYGERLCDIDWTWYNYGPFSQSVYGAVESLDAEGLIQDVLMTQQHSVRNLDMPEVDIPTAIGARHRYTAKRVLSRYGHLSLHAIKQVAYATETMRHAEQGERLDLMQETRRSVVDSDPALALLLQQAGEPDMRSWGEPEDSAAEDLEIMEELSGWREAANALHRV